VHVPCTHPVNISIIVVTATVFLQNKQNTLVTLLETIFVVEAAAAVALQCCCFLQAAVVRLWFVGVQLAEVDKVGSRQDGLHNDSRDQRPLIPMIG
jgi:hypothetical protein